LSSFSACCLAIAVCLTADAQTLGQRARQRFDTLLPEAEHLTWQVDGIRREALVYSPKKAEASEGPAPVVFGFHGHGGSAVNAARSFGFHKFWPEALVVYMQGLPTPGRLTDPEGKRNGWQHAAGDQADRDLKFFDAVLATLKQKYQVDSERIYASGHSNGGGFTYLLWAERPDVFAAMAPSAASSPVVRQLKPKPAMHIAGKNDQLVRFAWQQQTIEVVRKINGCAETGSAWAKDCTLYPSATGTPLVTFIHDGTHKYPPEAPPLIVKFFKEHRRQTIKRPNH
jgi:polyhydroxybutyrate depolymerase